MHMTATNKNRTPYLIVLLLGCFILFLGWAAYRASTHGSDITDTDYYSKGLRYNTTLVEKRAASVLGWQADVELKGRSLTIRLNDSQMQPVTQGEAVLLLVQPAAAAPRTLPLKESAPGTYRLALPADLHGEQHARLDFHKDGARLNRLLVLNL